MSGRIVRLDKSPRVVWQPELYLMTDMGNAEFFADLHANRLMYVVDRGAWLEWNGKIWEDASEGALVRAAKEATRAMLVDAADIQNDDARAAAAKYAASVQNLRKAKAMIEVAQSQEVLETWVDRLDQDAHLLTVENGVIDLSTGKLQHHRRLDLMTKMAPVPYDPNASAERFEQFLVEVFQDRTDLINFIQNAIGYSLTGDITAHVLFLCYGDGCNGKSVLLETLAALMGPHLVTAPFDTFVRSKHGEGIPHDLAMMRGARIVSASEGEEGAKFASAKIKRMTGGDQITARHLYEKLFTFNPTHKIWLATNHRPVINDPSNAMWRRIRLIPFDASFDGDRRDPKLLNKLTQELPGILAWAVRGAKRWYADGRGAKGLGAAASVTAAVEEYREDSDTFGQFLRECCVVNSDLSTPAKRAYARYSAWCDQNGQSPQSSSVFGRLMKQRGHAGKRTRNGATYNGIGLAADHEV